MCVSNRVCYSLVSLNHENHFLILDETFLNETEKIEPTSKSKSIKWAYVKKVKMFSSTMFVWSDQIYDMVLFIYLIIWKEFWFAGIFLVVDLLPAAFIIWNKLK